MPIDDDARGRGRRAGMAAATGAGLVDLAAATDPTMVGRKATGLADAMAAGHRVPEGVVVPIPVTRELRAGDGGRGHLADLLDGVLEGLGGVVAVRSSGVDEDTADHSYAGQYETVLGVQTSQDLVAAVLACTTSTDGGGAADYRARAGGGTGDMAVIVQQLVDADAAGVAFGIDPVTGDDHVVVEAVAGLGDEVLAGTVTPERWEVHHDPDRIVPPSPQGSTDGRGPTHGPTANGPRNGDGPTNGASTNWPSTHGSTRKPTGAGPRALDDDQVRAVARSCRALGRRHGGPVDIEFAVADGRLWLLQVRPVTAVPREPTKRPPADQTWLREPRFDGPIDPLTFSTWLPRHGAAMASVFATLGMPLRRIDSRRYLGRVYTRDVPMVDGKDRPPPPAPVFRLLMHVVPSLRRRMRTAARAAESGLVERLLSDWESTGRERLRSATRSLRAVDPESLDDAALAAHLDRVLAHVQHVGIVHFELALAGVYVATGRLGLFVEEVLGWSADEAIGLVAGFGAGSVEHGRALADLADALGRDGVARALAEPTWLITHPAAADYLDRFGHRAGHSLRIPTEAEAPAVIASHLARFVDGPPERPDPTSHARALEERAWAQLRDPDDRARFDDLLAVARRGRPVGDETEGDVLDALGLVRPIALVAARRMVDDGRLTRRDDVWLLEVEELGALLRDPAVPIPELDRRRSELRWAEANPAPDHFGPPPAPIPPPAAIPRAARPVVGAMLWSLAVSGMASDGDGSGSARGREPDRAAVDSLVEDLDGDVLTGTPGSPGTVTGPVRVVRDPSDFHRVAAGDVLVCPITMASWSPVFAVIGGLVTEHGGLLSHPATLAREYGIPAVLAVPDATHLLTEGATVTVDGASGRVVVR